MIKSEDFKEEEVARANELYHDALAGGYDARAVLAHPGVLSLYERVFQESIFAHFSRDKNISVLDLGCGSGLLEQFLVPRTKDITGIDISGGMLELAKAKFPELAFVRADLNKWDFDNKKYNLVISNSFYHHLKNYFKVLEKAASAVTAGGRALYGFGTQLLLL